MKQTNSQQQSNQPTSEVDNLFLRFSSDVSTIPLPEKFTFPFYYDTYPLADIASKEIQKLLQHPNQWNLNFGLDSNSEESGKMFGVLIVQNKHGELGYLSAFSGKLADSNHLHPFVPPVFDILSNNSFYKKGERILEKRSNEIEQLEQSIELQIERAKQIQELKIKDRYLAFLKVRFAKNKQERKALRAEGRINLNKEDFEQLELELGKTSIAEHYYLKDKTNQLNDRLLNNSEKLIDLESKLSLLIEQRAQFSSQLQLEIFEHYTFTNAIGESKCLIELFPISENKIPPAGSGDCAAPKLLQYAFNKQYTPICMAEFWWGKAPNSEIRKHGNFYPACNSKCKPILKHMLSATETDENPFLKNPSLAVEIPIVFENDFFAIINKPAEFLSVPGKLEIDSVADRMKRIFPNATGPLIVHRLDMSTSGIMLIAKTKEVHKHLQVQFENHTIKKRYVALLNGVFTKQKGTIELPIRADIEDRPRQMVCFEHGKSAITHWNLVRRFKHQTKVHFFPVSGRTHQLRVHAAHPDGLNCPIVGDDMYGTKAERLYLHAEWIQFKHPKTNEWVEFEIPSPF